MPEEKTYYKELADRMLNKIKSFDFLKITEEEVYEIIYSYINSSIIKFDSCKKDLEDRNENSFNFKLDNIEKEILTMFMLIEYIDSNYIRVPEKMETYFSSKDINSGSAWQQLGQLRQIREMYVTEVRQMKSLYSYKNSKLFVNNNSNDSVETNL